MTNKQFDSDIIIRACSLLTNTDYLIKLIPIIDPTIPKQPELRWVFFTVKKFYGKYNKAPSFDILRDLLFKDNKLKDEEKDILNDFIQDMENVKPKRTSSEYYSDVLEEIIRTCYFSNIAKEVTSLVNDNKIEEAENLIAEMRAPKRLELDLAFIPQDVKFIFEQKLEEQTIPTGINGLDSIIDGGLRIGELGVILSPTGYGKSMALVHFGAHAWKQNLNVVHFSFENSKEETARRYLTNLANQPFEVLVDNGGIDCAAIVKLIVKDKSQIAISKLIGSTTNTNDLYSHLCNIVDYYDFYPDLLIIDYGDLMKSIRKTDSRYDEMESVFAELRDLADRCQIPIWTATQSNREGLKSKRVKLEHIGISFGKAVTADVIISLSRPNKDVEDNDSDDFIDDDNDAIFRIEKLRRSEEVKKPIYVKTNFAMARFDEIDISDENEIDNRGELIHLKRKRKREKE